VQSDIFATISDFGLRISDSSAPQPVAIQNPKSEIRNALFDVVFCSGAFNLNLGNNLQFLPRAIGRMCELSRKYVVFNLLHRRAATETHRYFYADPAEIRRLLTSPACDVRIIDDYLPNDFTVFCYKTRSSPGRLA
jgi:hypothetical protein